MTSPDRLGSVIAEYKFDYLVGKTKFPFGLLIAQHITEGALSSLLIERLEKEMSSFIRGMKITGMRQHTRNGKNGFLVIFENGKRIWCQYIVGADGSRSTVSNK